MSTGPIPFRDRYRSTFGEYLERPDEVGLQAAYELGRQAVADKLSALDLARIHHDALAAALSEAASRAEIEATTTAGAAFMAEALSTFEMIQLGYLEAHQAARAERQHVMQLRRLADASLAINSAASGEEIFRVLAARARQIIGADLAAASLTRGDDWSQDIQKVSVSQRYRGRRQQAYAGAHSVLYGLVCRTNTSVGLTRAELRRRPGLADTDELSWERGWLAAPMIARDGSNMGLIQVWDKLEGDFTDKDEATLLQLAQSASVAIENRRLYEREREIAEILQRSLLPPRLPQIPGIEVATLYRPGGVGYQVGGDFYDLFEVGEGHWAMMIGDVCGKGPAAAALTGLARHTLRAAAMQEDDPRAVLRLLNEAMLRHGSEQFCTVAFARLRPNGRSTRATVVTAGHPTPLVLRQGGSVEELSCRGALLGVIRDPDPTSSEIELDSGDALVLYTDGLIESRGSRKTLDEKTLAALLASCAGLDAASTVATIERAINTVENSAARDDVAILVARHI